MHSALFLSCVLWPRLHELPIITAQDKSPHHLCVVISHLTIMVCHPLPHVSTTQIHANFSGPAAPTVHILTGSTHKLLPLEPNIFTKINDVCSVLIKLDDLKVPTLSGQHAYICHSDCHLSNYQQDWLVARRLLVWIHGQAGKILVGKLWANYHLASSTAVEWKAGQVWVLLLYFDHYTVPFLEIQLGNWL